MLFVTVCVLSCFFSLTVSVLLLFLENCVNFCMRAFSGADGGDQLLRGDPVAGGPSHQIGPLPA